MNRPTEILLLALLTLILVGTTSCSQATEPDEETDTVAVSNVPIRLPLSVSLEAFGEPNSVNDDMPEATAWFSFWRLFGLLRRNPEATIERFFDIYMDENHPINDFQDLPYSTGRYYPEGGQYIIGYAFGTLASRHFQLNIEQPADVYLQSHDDASTGEYVEITEADSSAIDNSDWEYIYAAEPNVAGANVPYDDDTRMEKYSTPSTTLDLFGDGYGNYSGRFVFHHVTTKLHLVMWRSAALIGSADELQVSNIEVYAPVSAVPTRLSWTASSGYYADAFNTAANRKALDSDPGDYTYRGSVSDAVGRNYKKVATYTGYLGSEGIDDTKPSNPSDYDLLPYARTLNVYLDLNDRVLNKQAAYSDHSRDVIELVVFATYGNNTRKRFYVELQPTPTLNKTDEVYLQGESYNVILVFDSDSLKMSAELLDWDNGGVGVIDIVKPSNNSEITDIKAE
jgi:hypothetical protein